MGNLLDLEAINVLLRQFARDRDWEQFHTPKNLSMALTRESAELMELFQWLTEAQSRQIMDTPQSAQAVRHELADILLYVLRIADLLGVDLQEAVTTKLALNAQKYPVALARGNALKYTDLGPVRGNPSDQSDPTDRTDFRE